MHAYNWKKPFTACHVNGLRVEKIYELSNWSTDSWWFYVLNSTWMRSPNKLIYTTYWATFRHKIPGRNINISNSLGDYNIGHVSPYTAQKWGFPLRISSFFV